MRVLLRGSQTLDPRQFAVGTLTLDVVIRKVARAGQPIELTLREFELLEYLMRHAGEVVSRESLARDVWRETNRTTPLDNVIDVHMMRLRRKLDGDGANGIIHTIRGAGFMVRDGDP
jgi:two-component system copper resistance phosphate regulon response regulator CusR